MTLGYALVLLGMCLACGVLLWHYVGRRFSSTSTVSRISWSIGLGMGATVVIYLAFALSLAVNIALDVAFEPGNNFVALAGFVVVMLFVGIWSVLVPALPYGIAAGTAFYLIAEQFDWMNGGARRVISTNLENFSERCRIALASFDYLALGGCQAISVDQGFTVQMLGSL